MKILIYNSEKIDDGFMKLIRKYDSDKQERIMFFISELIKNFGGKPVPPFAKPLADVGGELFEIRIKLGDMLLRVNYFLDEEKDYLVILNAYEKPNGTKDKNNYNKKKKKELDKKIKKVIDNALEYKKQYFLNNKDYEFLN